MSFLTEGGEGVDKRLPAVDTLVSFVIQQRISRGTAVTQWKKFLYGTRARFVSFTFFLNPFIPDSVKPKIDKFSNITNWVKLNHRQFHSKVLLNSFPMNDHTLGFCP